MKTYNLILFGFFFICIIPAGIYAQDSSSIALTNLSTNYCNHISNSTKKLQHKIDKRSDKALRKYAKYEKAILRKLYKADSVAARNFSIVSEQKYSDLQRKLSAPGSFTRYIPSLDTITSSLKFLQQSSLTRAGSEEVRNAITHITSFTGKLKNAEDIKHYLQENKGYIKDQLNRFGLSKELTKVNKNLYYYSEEIIGIKETFRDHRKLERKVLSMLSRMKPFQEFIQKHGMLASLFGTGNPDNGLPVADLAGLQTRSGINEIIQNQLAAGGPNAQGVMQANMQAGQAQLQQLKNKLSDYGNRGSEDIMPEGFTPNTQKAKSFFKRLEVTTNLQSQKVNGYFPASTALGLGIGYRLFDAGTIGVGTSYKLGLGENIRHIKLTHEGIGLRSYIDLKFPVALFGLKKGRGSWWITGGYERNYLTTIKKIADLKDHSAWQASALLGISKNISFSSKPLKGTKMQLLWDFLSYRQIPRPSPLVFRMGYTLR
jgi:hypothetical protein